MMVIILIRTVSLIILLGKSLYSCILPLGGDQSGTV